MPRGFRRGPAAGRLARRLDILALCPFSVGVLLWEAKPSQWSLTVCVKATFSLVDGGDATVAEVQDPIFGDRPWDNDPHASLFGPDDLVPLKPKVDVLLAGHAYSPDGVPVPELVATLRVGDFAKSLRVTGDRFWSQGPAGLVASEPMPFSSMPIRYERAARSMENPVGIDLEAERPGSLAAANIEAEEGWMPGFGAISPAWPLRRDMLTAAALAWVESVTTSRDPSQGPAPHGVDFRFFNAAPEDQQLDMLRVGTPISLENLHPTLPVIESRLPAVRPQVFRVDPASGRVTEVALRSDTLWIHSDRGVAVVSYRGLTDVRGGTYEAVGRLVVTADPNGKRISCERVDKALRENALHEISAEGEDRSRLLEMRHDAVLPRSSADPTVKQPKKAGAKQTPASSEPRMVAPAPVPALGAASPSEAKKGEELPGESTQKLTRGEQTQKAVLPFRPSQGAGTPFQAQSAAPSPVASAKTPVRAPLPLDLPIGDETIRAPEGVPAGPATPFETPSQIQMRPVIPAALPEVQSRPPLVAPPPIPAPPVVATPAPIAMPSPVAPPPPEIRLPAAALAMEIGGETLRVGANSTIQKDVLPFQASTSGEPAAAIASPAAAKTPVIRGLSAEMLGRSIGDETVRASESTPAKPVMPFVSKAEQKESKTPKGDASSSKSSKPSPIAEALKSAGAAIRGIQAQATPGAPQKPATASPPGEKTTKMSAAPPAEDTTKKLARPVAQAPAADGATAKETKGQAPPIKEDSKTLPRVIINAPLGSVTLSSKKPSSSKLGVPPAAGVAPSPAIAKPKAPPEPDPGAAEVAASIEKYAAIAAEIGMKGSNKGKVLKANGLSTASWADIDEKWSDAVAQALETGDRALVDAFDAAYIATQERLGKRIGVVEYARILVGIERGEVGRVLASLELALSDLVRIQRVWAKKLAATPALGAEVEKTVDAIRAEPGLS